MNKADYNKRCPVCGKKADARWSFCTGCGAVLDVQQKDERPMIAQATGIRPSLTMTINDVCALFRTYGISIDARRMADSIATGIYPFGRVVRVSESGRRTFEIWRTDVDRFLKSKIPKEEIENE